jgi:hypothetical protein
LVQKNGEIENWEIIKNLFSFSTDASFEEIFNILKEIKGEMSHINFNQ